MVKRKRVELKGDINLLSPLEEKIMDFLWENSNSSVSKISQHVGAPLSSVAATIDRLVQHGYVIRKREKIDGRMKYIYSPALKREEANQKLVESILDTLVEKFGDVVVNYFQKRDRSK